MLSLKVGSRYQPNERGLVSTFYAFRDMIEEETKILLCHLFKTTRFEKLKRESGSKPQSHVLPNPVRVRYDLGRGDH